MSLSLMSGPKVMVSSARYFESKGAEKRAVQLYQRAGKLAKALDLCFRARLFDELKNIADDLASGSKDASSTRNTGKVCLFLDGTRPIRQGSASLHYRWPYRRID